MVGRIVYAVFGSIALVVSGIAAASGDPKAQSFAMVAAIAGIGFMLAAVAFSLGEMAAARKVPPAPPVPMVPVPYPPQPYGTPVAPASGPVYGQPYGQ